MGTFWASFTNPCPETPAHGQVVKLEGASRPLPLPSGNEGSLRSTRSRGKWADLASFSAKYSKIPVCYRVLPLFLSLIQSLVEYYCLPMRARGCGRRNME